MTSDVRPIGIYDSGVGGLSTLREIRAALPHEPLVYLADAGYLPYGEKSQDTLERRALAVADYFVSRGVKAIAVACNTATAAAIGTMRQHHPDLIVVGIEPAIKPAAQLSRSGVIGVFATTGTLASQRFAALAQRAAPGSRIVLRPCPEWVMLVENGQLDDDAARASVNTAAGALLAEGADVLVLGCTHFPFLQPLLRERVGPDVHIVEPGPALARHLAHRVQTEAATLLAPDGFVGGCELVSSGDAGRLRAQARQLLQWDLPAVPLPPPWR
ncbi:glutamate racemase [Bordetella genomosp. 13]|uniref:Glutamate racemase n=1 Tax=Bordetella genomosp. 13 TaxID=463040 RepID=A0A1W6ZF68_9BORD|nr:glutamate racemase [Bordetella genomosp. 13]ARP95947.1 glutamate racemase [Bordetella genomosp. 13]